MKLQSDKKITKEQTKQVRIDVWWHKFVKLLAADRGVTTREIIEEALSTMYDIDAYKEVQKKL